MQKKILAIVSVVLSAYLCVAFSGCDSKQVIFNNGTDGEVESVVFTAKNDVLAIDETTSVEDYLNALKAQGALEFEASNGQYGMFIEAVNGRKNVTDENGTHGFSWSVYTNLIELDGVVYSSDEYGAYKLDDGTILNSAYYGVTFLPCVEGYTYALVYSEWSY